MELSELEIKMLLILKNTNNKWKSPTEFSAIFNNKFKSGISDKRYSLNWICIRLRTLNEIGYLEKQIFCRNGQGRLSLYQLTIKGLEKIEEVLK